MDTLSIDDLSLVDEADLEENIAVKNIVNKVSHHCAQDLSAIEKRLSHILDTEVSAENNPLGPNIICHSFMQAAATLEIDLKISLIILKLFDYEIINGIQPLLNEANAVFINANVLPEFKHTVQKSQHVDSPYDSQADTANPQANNPGNTMDAAINNGAGAMAGGMPGSMAGNFAQSGQATIPGGAAGQPSLVGNNMHTGNSGLQDTSIAQFHQLLNQLHAQQHYPAGNGQAGQVGQGTAENANHINMSTGAIPGAMHGAMQGPGNANPAGEASGNTGFAAAEGTIAQADMIPTPQFVGSLTQLQAIPHDFMQPTTIVTEDENGEAVEQPGLQAATNLKQYVVQQLQQQDKDFSIQHIDPLDQDVIDVVSMLFEFILEDKNIPDAAKAHIARLQIPLLKAAIIDKEFFSTSKNTARTLLNELAHAAIGIIDEDDEASQKLLGEIERVVNTINDEFEDDLDLFKQQHALFMEFMEQHEQQEYTINQRIEKKIKQKEDNALAFHWVEDTVNEILKNKHLPEAIVDLINGPWKRVMLNTYLNNGQDSDTWKNQVRFIDVLEWSIQPKHESLDRQKLANIIGQLVLTLRNGLQVIEVSDEEIQDIMSQLEPFHMASIKGISVKEYLDSLTPEKAFLFADNEQDKPTETESSQYEQDDDSVSNHSDSIIVEEVTYQPDEDYQTDLSLDEIDQTISNMEQELNSLEELAASVKNSISEDEPVDSDTTEQNDIFEEMEDDFILLGDNEHIDDDTFSKLITEDIILSGYSTEEDEAPADQPQDEYLELARHLEQGKWVEFLDDNKQKTRAKLAWKSDLLGEYTFLNWKFDVVADKTLYGLAADLRRGTATIIDDVPLVDRALSAVMSSLTPSGNNSQTSSG